MIGDIEKYWDDWQPPPVNWYGLSVNISDLFSPEVKALQRELMQMSPLRRWLSFRMRRELYHRKATELLHGIIEAGREAMERME